MNAHESRLPHARFDTSTEPPARRLEAWRAAVGVLFEVEIAEPDAAERPIVLDNWQLGPAVLTAGRGPGFFYRRSTRASARDGRDLFMCQVYRAGQCRVVEGGDDVVSRPGDLVITDLARPIRTQETAFDNVNLLLPRSLLAPLLRDPDVQGGRVVRVEQPLAALAHRHLAELVAQAPRLPPAHAGEVLEATVQLLAAALNGGVGDATRAGVEVTLGCQVRRFIDAHLDEDLAPAVLAARFGLSRATLYRLFAHDGGVRRYTQARRLARARRHVISPVHRHRTVAEIAAMAGYAHAQDFIRAYRRAFGPSPGDERAAARLEGRLRVAPGAPRVPTWVEWVRRIA